LSLETGQTLLHYRLVEKIGEGGMGVVWRALDTSLDRDVAIKVLPDAFSQDAARLTRFEREAKLLASLRHANIAAVYGLHEARPSTSSGPSVRFLAMEMVEGEDLAQRLNRGALPMDEALEIGRSIAEAMETAHEQGVIHRDLKPANVKVAPDGTVKVLDFGLAKAMEAGTGQSAESQLANSPTMTQAATAQGVILGTAAYMAPEQAKGKTVDKRADIWAFGVMLNEMLTGRRMFEGETAAEVLGGVFRQEIRLDELPASTPRRVRTLIGRCLERDPKQRLRDIGEARIALSGAEEATEIEAAAPAQEPRLWPALAVLGLVIGAVGSWMLKPTPTPPLRRLSLAAPEGFEGPRMSPRISPDGRAMAYVADRQLWIQDLDQLTARPVTAGAEAEQFDWSPDGSSLAFTVRTQLWRTGMSGDPTLIADLPAAVGSRGGALCWTADDTIVYSTGDNNLFEVPVTGGFPEVLLEPDLEKEADFHEPSALPGRRGILYVVHRVPQGIDTLEVLADGRRTVIFQEDGANLKSPVYASTGHVLFERRGVSRGVWSLPFSLSDLEATGPPVLVTSTGSWPSLSADGSLLFSNLASAGNHQLVFVDRRGTIVEDVGDPLQHADNARLSPDGRLLAICVDEGRDNNLWIYDLERGSRTQLVHQSECGGRNGDLAWSPDGSSVVFGDTATKTLRQVRVDGAGEAPVLTEGMHAEFSPDGRLLILARESGSNGVDIWTLVLDGEAEPQPFAATGAREDMPRISPAGDLLAYVSDETGRAEIYLRPFPSGAGKWQVSASGGDFPRWSPSGDRLYYLQDESSVIEVAVTSSPTLQLGRAREVFAFNSQQLGPNHGYDVTRGDDRFVMVRFGESTTGAGDLTLITNWAAN